jgi:hypothetical protein
LPYLLKVGHFRRRNLGAYFRIEQNRSTQIKSLKIVLFDQFFSERKQSSQVKKTKKKNKQKKRALAEVIVTFSTCSSRHCRSPT